MPDAIKPEILRFAVMFDHRCKEGSKAVIHLEAFIARVMSIYKGYMVNS
jgi:replication factor C subunit 3/5